MNAKILFKLIQRMGHEIVHVINGKEAVDTFEKGKFDLVLMDICMPEIDGIEATRMIHQKNTESERVPIIALSALEEDLINQREGAALLDGYLSKPLQTKRLLALLEAIAKKENFKDIVTSER